MARDVRTVTKITDGSMPENPFDRADPSTTATAVTALQQVVIAINRLTKAVGNVSFQSTGTSSSATGGAATLPANPVGFLNIELPDGSQAKVPYYDV